MASSSDAAKEAARDSSEDFREGLGMARNTTWMAPPGLDVQEVAIQTPYLDRARLACALSVATPDITLRKTFFPKARSSGM
jgi:hypothetical protein